MMAAKKSSSGRKYGKAASKRVKSAMHRRKKGTLKSGSGRKVTLPRGSSDAALMSYHVERSKLYVMERIEGIAALDKRRIARAIEGTRFPASFPSEDQEVDEGNGDVNPAISMVDRRRDSAIEVSDVSRGVQGVVATARVTF